MEPFIVDYYNEMPHGVDVIENMNDELSEVQIENELLKKRIKLLENACNRPKPTIIKGEDIDKYFLQGDNLREDLGSVMEDSKYEGEGEENYLDLNEIFKNKDKLINLLHKFLVNVSEEWCSDRINSSLRHYSSLRYVNGWFFEPMSSTDALCDNIIDMMIRTIVDDDDEYDLDTISGVRITDLYVVKCDTCSKCRPYDQVEYDENMKKVKCYQCYNDDY